MAGRRKVISGAALGACAWVCALSGVAFAGVYNVRLDTSPDRVESPLRVAMNRIGTLKPRSVSEIAGSSWMVGCETLDRDYMNFDEYKEFIEPLGIRQIRLQAGWAKTERTKGVFDFKWLDDIVYYAKDRGVEVFMELVYGNPIYEGAGGWDLGMGLPSSPEGKEAWNRWVDEITRHYKGVVGEWAIWNEPDTTGLFGVLKEKVEIVDINVRTAKIILKNIPDAKIGLYDLAWLNPKYIEELLRLTPKDAFGMFTYFMYHDYQVQPEATYPKVAVVRELLRKYNAGHLVMRQGENGCPSEMAVLFALGKIPWSEYSQAKWVLRRMLGDLGHDIPSSVFTLSEFNHRANAYRKAEINHKGLLRINANREVIAVKRAFYAVQNVVSLFDSTVVRVKEPAVTNPDLQISLYEYRTAAGDPIFVYWDHGDVVRHPYSLDAEDVLGLNPDTSSRLPLRPGDSFETRPIVLEYAGRPLSDPVWVDLMTGRIYEFPRKDMLAHSCGVTLVNVPAYDSPCLLTERRAVVRPE